MKSALLLTLLPLSLLGAQPSLLVSQMELPRSGLRVVGSHDLVVQRTLASFLCVQQTFTLFTFILASSPVPQLDIFDSGPRRGRHLSSVF